MPSVEIFDTRAVVSFQPREQQFTVTQAEASLCHSLCEQGKLVMAIKFIREQYNLGLYDAKMIVDTIRDHYKWIPAQEPKTLGQLLKEKLEKYDG